MFQFLLNGIYYGFILSFLIGPIFFALLQAAIEKGTKTGLIVASGVWFSDLLYILTVYFSLAWIKSVSELPDFGLIVGGVGAVVLILFGIGMVLNNKPVDKTQRIEKSGYVANFVKGFLINTVNPFTVFFWIAMSSEILAVKTMATQTIETTPNEAFAFFGGILGMIVFTDVVKVLLAKKITKYLTQKHILAFRKIAGAALIIGGIVLVYRSAF